MKSVNWIEVHVQYGEEITSPIAEKNWQSWFEIWLKHLKTTYSLPKAKAYELSLRLTDDKEIQSLNDQYRFKDQPTDVLAFAALEVESPPIPEEDRLYLGDIVISLETAQRQAREQDHAFSQEVIWLASHGFLHLLGWDHPDETSLAAMLSCQESLLNLVGISSSLR